MSSYTKVERAQFRAQNGKAFLTRQERDVRDKVDVYSKATSRRVRLREVPTVMVTGKARASTAAAIVQDVRGEDDTVQVPVPWRVRPTTALENKWLAAKKARIDYLHANTKLRQLTSGKTVYHPGKDFRFERYEELVEAQNNVAKSMNIKKAEAFSVRVASAKGDLTNLIEPRYKHIVVLNAPTLHKRFDDLRENQSMEEKLAYIRERWPVEEEEFMETEERIFVKAKGKKRSQKRAALRDSKRENAEHATSLPSKPQERKERGRKLKQLNGSNGERTNKHGVDSISCFYCGFEQGASASMRFGMAIFPTGASWKWKAATTRYGGDDHNLVFFMNQDGEHTVASMPETQSQLNFAIYYTLYTHDKGFQYHCHGPQICACTLANRMYGSFISPVEPITHKRPRRAETNASNFSVDEGKLYRFLKHVETHPANFPFFPREFLLPTAPPLEMPIDPWARTLAADWVFAANFERCSQLNGANGEATNSDDVVVELLLVGIFTLQWWIPNTRQYRDEQHLLRVLGVAILLASLSARLLVGAQEIHEELLWAPTGSFSGGSELYNPGAAIQEERWDPDGIQDWTSTDHTPVFEPLTEEVVGSEEDLGCSQPLEEPTKAPVVSNHRPSVRRVLPDFRMESLPQSWCGCLWAYFRCWWDGLWVAITHARVRTDPEVLKRVNYAVRVYGETPEQEQKLAWSRLGWGLRVVLRSFYLDVWWPDCVLSGNNGEWTNGDDMEHNNKQKRQFKEANTAKYQKPVNGGRTAWQNANDAFHARERKREEKMELELAETKSDPEPLHLRADLEEYSDHLSSADGEPKTTLFVVIPMPGIPPLHLWSGEEYCDLFAYEHAVGRVTKVVYPTVVEGTVLDNIILSGPGYLVQTTNVDKGGRAVASLAYEIVELPAAGCEFPPQVYRPFIPYTRSLQRMLPGKFAEHSPDAYMAYLSKISEKTGMLSSEYAETAHAYAHSQYLVLRNFGKHGKYLRALGKPVLPVGREEVHEMRVVNQVGVDVDLHKPVKVFAEECHIETDYEPRYRYRIIPEGGARCEFFDAENNILPLIQRVYPAFPTERDPNRQGLYRTEFFRFSGTNVHSFVQYDKTPNNATKALKRMLGALEFGDAYYANQLNLLSKLHAGNRSPIPLMDHLAEDVLTACRTRFTPRTAIVGVLRKGKYHRVPLERSAMHEMCEEAKFPSVKVDPSAIMEQAVPHMRALHMRSDFFTVINTYLETAEKIGVWAYARCALSMMTVMDAIIPREFCANIPHIKRELRRLMVKRVSSHDDDELMVRKLKAQVKNELAKFNKIPRLFVAYDAGAMYANELPEFLKMALDGLHVFDLGGMTMEIFIMAKPRGDSLSQIFEKAYTASLSRNSMFVGVYSDDTIYAGNIDGKRFMCNVDISSCDSNQASLNFYQVGYMLAQFNKERAIGLLKQCGLEIVLTNPCAEKERLRIQMHGLFEGSGTVLTTILNHTASATNAILTGLVLNDMLQRKCSIDVPECIKFGAYLGGHEVTVEDCSVDSAPCVEKLQFLKHSPMFTTKGSLVPVLNIGCVLRSLGTHDGDITATTLGLSTEDYVAKNWGERADYFIGSIINGLKHEPKHPIIAALRSRFPLLAGRSMNVRDWLPNSVSVIEDNSDRGALEVDPDSFARRYDMSSDEMGVLCNQIEHIIVGRRVSGMALERIYRADYGVGDREFHV